ncbi:BSD domain-containing protein 1, partial [Coemansia aciculifera]
MDAFAFQLQTDAAESEGCPQQSPNPDADSLPSLSSMFGFAASWGKKIQTDLQLTQLVDQVKKQSEEVTKAYSQDLSEFAQAVRVGATRGIDELSTRFSQIKAEFKDEEEAKGEDTSVSSQQQQEERSVSGGPATAEPSSQGLFGGISRHFQSDVLRQRQEKAKRLMSKLGADLEDLLREAIVIEAPGSASTEEQRNAARKIIYDRRMAQLAAIQESTDTYLVDPRTTVVEIPGATNGGADDSSSSSRFDEFVGEFSLDERQEEVALMLKEDNSVVAQMHKTLVEEKKVTEQEFWTRYFYRVWLVDQEEVRRKKLVEAAVAAA